MFDIVLSASAAAGYKVGQPVIVRQAGKPNSRPGNVRFRCTLNNFVVVIIFRDGLGWQKSASVEGIQSCTASDMIKDWPLTLPERYALAMHGHTEKRRKRKDLPSKVELAIGMKVMVTSNVETDLDITNRAHGEIVDIVLHLNEPTLPDEPIVQL